MDWYSLGIAAFACAIAGGVIIFLLGKLKNGSKIKAYFLAVLIGLLTFSGVNYVGTLSDVKDAVLAYFDVNYYFKQTLKMRLGKVLEIPEVKEKISRMHSFEEIRDYATSVVRLGMRHLSNEDLLTWNRLRNEMSEASAELCSTFWNGNNNNQVFLDTMAKLHGQSIDDWVELCYKAARLEVTEGAYTPTTSAEFMKGLKKIASGLSQEEQIKMELVLTLGKDATPEDGCWLMKKLIKGADQLEGELKFKFIRQLATF